MTTATKETETTQIISIEEIEQGKRFVIVVDDGNKWEIDHQSTSRKELDIDLSDREQPSWSDKTYYISFLLIDTQTEEDFELESRVDSIAPACANY